MGRQLRLLLDTHALLWWWTNDSRLGERPRELILDRENAIFVSAASAWEISTKVRLGKMPGAETAVSRFGELVAADGFSELPITLLHALRAGGYDIPHRDPFDRMLAAQSEIEALPIVSLDTALTAFPCEVIW